MVTNHEHSPESRVGLFYEEALLLGGGLPPEYESYIRQVDHNAGRWMFSIDWPGEYHVSEESYGSPEEALAAVEQFLKAR